MQTTQSKQEVLNSESCYVKATIQPQHWHEWGNEPRGLVSTFAYDKWGDYHFTGYRTKDQVNEWGLTFLNPYA